MLKKTTFWLQGLLIVGAIGGMEYWFFHAPDLSARPAQASIRAKKPTQVAAAPAAKDQPAAAPTVAGEPLRREGEKHLTNIRQLTFGGENAEAYWSPDGARLTLQSRREGLKADQIFTMNADGSDVKMVSTGKGRTTCSYFYQDGERILYASTHRASDEPPAPPDQSQGYVWPVYADYDIFTCKTDGSDLERLTKRPGYDAEATVSPDGKKIVFTSMRDGDLEIYVTDINGRNTRRLTHELGYDGGAFFSPDSEWICYRAGHPQGAEEEKTYRELLEKGLVKPSKMELWIMRADGSGKRQVTSNGAANFCPFFTPDGKQLIFSSNMKNPRGRDFDLYLINLDGSGQEQVTFDPSFDGFPMFSPDGKKLVWASNRNAKEKGETNVFVADWAP